MKDDSFQIALLRLQSDLHNTLRDMHDVRKVLIYGLKVTAALLRADEAVAATLNAPTLDTTTLDRVDDSVKTLFSIPKQPGFEDELLYQFLKDQRPETDHNTLLVPVRRKSRSWVVMALKPTAISWNWWLSVLHGRKPRAGTLGGVFGSTKTRNCVCAKAVYVCTARKDRYGTRLSILKISARRPNVLGAYEAELVDSFMPLVSLVVQFSGHIESLRAQVLEAERKHVLADMARATAHDVNHALGTILPRVQVLRGELQEGALDTGMLEEDLHDIEVSVQTCRRIFDGMLAIARETNRGLGHGNVIRVIEQSLSVLQDRLRRKQIEVAMDSPVELPAVRGRQGDITRLFLNLCGNAIDAMEDGGRLIISVETTENALKILLQDDGCGIPEGIMHKVMEPFYSNKENGSGLGLAICRSIMREIGGEMTIESTEGEGTQVLLDLPYLDEPLLEIA